MNASESNNTLRRNNTHRAGHVDAETPYGTRQTMRRGAAPGPGAKEYGCGLAERTAG